MAKYNVVWTKTADIQFYGILEYWVSRNKSAAYSKTMYTTPPYRYPSKERDLALGNNESQFTNAIH